MECRTVSPLRDPVFALISRHERHPDMDHCFIVDGFSALQHYDTIYVPIDLAWDNRGHRFFCLAASLDLLDEPEDNKWVNQYCEEWSEPNSRGWYDLKLRYRDDKDLDAVKAAMPKEYAYLISKADEIIPLLKEVGYKDLPWWSEV